jgi:hypothetical protein
MARGRLAAAGTRLPSHMPRVDRRVNLERQQVDLPVGYHARPGRREDLDAVFRLVAACERHDDRATERTIASSAWR